MTDVGATEAEGLVEDYLTERLEAAQEPPGLRAAVEARLAARIGDIADRGKAQIKHLKAKGPNRPQAYYAHEEAPEHDLQAAAAGIRTAMAMEGQIVDSVRFERAATQRLASTATWALRSEASRVPRPPTRPAELAWSLPPIPWVKDKAYIWPPPEAVALAPVRELAGNDLARCAEAPHAGWVQVGFLERQRTFASRYPEEPSRRLTVSLGLKVTNGEAPSRYLPFGGSQPEIWTHPWDLLVPELNRMQAKANLSTLARSLTCILDFDDTSGIPNPDRGPGLHPFMLAPSIDLVALLGLRPSTASPRMILVDDSGPALVCRLWSGFLIHDGDFEPLEPAVVGTDLLLRQDLFECLRVSVGSGRLRLGLSLRWSRDDDPVAD